MRALAAAALALIASANAWAVEAPRFDPSTGAVFPPERALQLTKPCSRLRFSGYEGTWAPGEKQIQALETRLAPFLADRMAYDHVSLEMFPIYYRQYGGVIIGGKHLIQVNGFTFNPELGERPPKIPDVVWQRYLTAHDWRNVANNGCDVGTSAFGVEYDPTDDSLHHFAFSNSLAIRPEGYDFGKRAIFSDDAARTLIEQCLYRDRRRTPEVWNPTLPDIEAFDLPLYRDTWPKVRRRSHSEYSDYYLPFAGYVESGHRLIFVHAISGDMIAEKAALEQKGNFSNPSDAWMAGPTRNCSDGRKSFGVSYDLTTGRFTDVVFSNSQ
jgi:hypothetical protein